MIIVTREFTIFFDQITLFNCNDHDKNVDNNNKNNSNNNNKNNNNNNN